MLPTLEALMSRVAAHIRARIDGWRTGSRGSQIYALGLLLAGVGASFVLTWTTQDIVPFSVWFVWLLIGVLILRFVPLVLLSVVVVAAAAWSSAHIAEMQGQRLLAMILLILSVALVLHQSSGQRSGLPITLGEATLAQLRDRLQSQGRVPPLPEGWVSHAALRTAHGPGYAGDFVVAGLQDGHRLEMVLVDVCGKGVTVGAQALQFAGALGGLLGALPPHDLMRAANSFLLRQDSEESFATAVHAVVELESGEYTVTCAGHPPALHWRAGEGWMLESARGLALGIVPDPELRSSHGRLVPGEALMFYTDGVVESRGRDLDEGIEWLRDTALIAVEHGFDGAARRILAKVPEGNDDRALLILERRSAGTDDDATSAVTGSTRRG